MITMLFPLSLACAIPAFAISTGLTLSPIENTGISICFPTTSNCFIAAGL